MKFYVSFGLITHEIRGKVFNQDTLCEIECKNVVEAREKAFEEFGEKWCACYSEQVAKDLMEKYDWTIVPLPPNRWEMFHMDKWIGVSADVAAYCNSNYRRWIRLA